MKRSLREHVSIFLFSAFCTAVYVCFFSDAFFSTLFEADATMYMGLGYEYLTSYVGDHYYKISRWPWVFLQFLRMKLFGGILGGFVLHGTLIFALHVILLRLGRVFHVDSWVGRIFAVQAGYLVLWYGYQADYHGFFQSVWFLGGLLHLLESKDRWHRPILQTVVVVLGMTITPLFGWYFVPLFCILFAEELDKDSSSYFRLLFDFIRRLLSLRNLIGVGVMGGLLLTAITILHSVMAGRQFFLKSLMVHLHERLTSGKSLVPTAGLYSWAYFLKQKYTLFYLLMAIVCLLVLIRLWWRKERQPQLVLSLLQFLVLFGSSLFLHFVLKQETYLREYMTALIFASSLLTLLALSGWGVESSPISGWICCLLMAHALYLMPNTPYLKSPSPIWKESNRRRQTRVFTDLLQQVSPFRGKDVYGLLHFPDTFFRRDSIPQQLFRNLHNGLNIRPFYDPWSTDYPHLSYFERLLKWKKKKKRKPNFLLWQLRWRGPYHILITTSTSERLNDMLKTVVRCKGVKVQVRKTGKYVVIPKRKYKDPLELHFLVARLQCQKSNCRL